MEGTEYEFSDEALRAAAFAAFAARTARRNDDNAGGHRGKHDTHDTHTQHDRKRPRRSDEHRGAVKARRRSAPTTHETMRYLLDALHESTAKPICEGGLAHYFITEAHRRADMIVQGPNPRAGSALSSPPVFDAIAAASRKEGRHVGGDCPVCLQDMQDASCDGIALPCGHAFHTRCIVYWLETNSSCPCCRVKVPLCEPYRYPARTKLQNPLLRDRVEGVMFDIREMALRTSYIEGMQNSDGSDTPAGILCMLSSAAQLGPVPAMTKDRAPEDTEASASRLGVSLPSDWWPRPAPWFSELPAMWLFRGLSRSCSGGSVSRCSRPSWSPFSSHQAMHGLR